MTELTNAIPVTKLPPLPIDTFARREISILIVDDEPGIRSFLQRALGKEYGLVEAVDRVEAAEALRLRCRFDILIVDISLPGRSGLEWVADLDRKSTRLNSSHGYISYA